MGKRVVSYTYNNWFEELKAAGFPTKMGRPPNADSDLLVFAEYVTSTDLIEALGKDNIDHSIFKLKEDVQLEVLAKCWLNKNKL